MQIAVLGWQGAILLGLWPERHNIEDIEKIQNSILAKKIMKPETNTRKE